MDRKRGNQDISDRKSEVKILFAGAGGQGILLMGKVLAQSLLLEGSQLSWFPSYGAEVRGGTCKCMVTSSTDEIASPYIIHPDYLIVMNEPSYVKYTPSLDSKGVIFYNQSLLGENVLNTALNNVSIPATEIASEIGNVRCANMTILGCFIKHTGIVKIETVEQALPDLIEHKELLKLDIAALDKGYSYV